MQISKMAKKPIENYLLKYLAVGVLPGKLPQPHRDLNFLSIHISFNDANDILTTFCHLRSFPALQELEIRANKKDQAVVGDVNYGLDNNQNCLLTKLRLVKITGISGVGAELDFIRFLLSSSPVLKKMIVAPATVNDFQLVKKNCSNLSASRRMQRYSPWTLDLSRKQVWQIRYEDLPAETECGF